MTDQIRVEEPKTVEEFKCRINRHKKQLLSCLEYQYGLNDLLCNWLSPKEYSKLKQIAGSYEQNKTLLEILHKRQIVQEYKDFMEKLGNSFQSHLKALIYTDNNFNKGDGNRPLADFQRQYLKSKRPDFVKILANEVNGLLDVTCRPTSECISEYHRRSVSEAQRSFDKARELLDIVENRSFVHFQGFRICLQELNSKAYDLTEFITAEDQDKSPAKGIPGFLAVDGITSTTSDKSLAELEEVASSRLVSLKKSGVKKEFFKVLGLMKRKSIRTLIHYSDLAGLEALEKEVKGGQIKHLLQMLCDTLLKEFPAGTLRIERIFMVDYAKELFYQHCSKLPMSYLGSDPKCDHAVLRNGGEKMRSVLHNVAHQSIKRRILTYTFMWKIKKGLKLTSRPDLEAFESLSSVSRDWLKMARQDEFKITIMALRNKLLKKCKSMKLRCEIMIPMPNATCATSIEDDIYLTTEFEVNTMYLLKQVPEVQQESGRPRRIPLQRIELQVLERIQIADNLDVLGMEAAEDGTGIFCINRPDGSIWFWTRSEARNPATVLQQFSASSCVTVCPEDSLRIVVLRDSNVLEMHNQPSELIQVMDLPDYITKPNAIACNNDGDVIVSYGSDADEHHRISMVDRRGRVVLTYGDKKGSGPNQLNNPSSITLDHDEDILYVVDKNNGGRILALDKNLDLINVVLDCKYDDLRNITSVHYAKVSKQLVVVHQDMVSLYKIHRLGAQEVAK